MTTCSISAYAFNNSNNNNSDDDDDKNNYNADINGVEVLECDLCLFNLRQIVCDTSANWKNTHTDKKFLLTP